MERFDVLLQFILLPTFFMVKEGIQGFGGVNVVEVGFGRERIGVYE